MFWFKHTAQITALQQEIETLHTRLTELESYIHSDSFHELLSDGAFDESKLDDLAQEAIDRCVENATLTVRF